MRRLYDIANVLTTLGLIKKKTFLAPNHRKMPGYAWAGPSMEEIQAIRKSLYHGIAIFFYYSSYNYTCMCLKLRTLSFCTIAIEYIVRAYI